MTSAVVRQVKHEGTHIEALHITRGCAAFGNRRTSISALVLSGIGQINLEPDWSIVINIKAIIEPATILFALVILATPAYVLVSRRPS